MMSAARKLIERLEKKRRREATEVAIRAIKRIVDSWSEITCCLIELIQNADDAGATLAEIIFLDKGMLFRHNGKKFDEKDVEAISDIGITTKKRDVHIGWLGIGFKSVFKITNKPMIFSGDYRFYFDKKDFIVPRWIEKEPGEVKDYLKEDMTVFYMPWSNESVKERLINFAYKELDARAILFLRNIRELRIRRLGVSPRRIIKSDLKWYIRKKNFEVHEVHLTDRGPSGENSYIYVIFRQELKIPDWVKEDPKVKEDPTGRYELQSTNIMLAFRVNEEGIFILEEYPLFTFLPTPIRFGFKFIVNADFILIANRRELDKETKWNTWLLGELPSILHKAVKWFRRRKNVTFYRCMPKKSDVTKELHEIVEIFYKLCKSDKIIFTSNHRWAKPEEVVILSEELQGLIPPKVFGYKYYVHPNVVKYGKEFLKALGVNEIKETDAVIRALSDHEWVKNARIKTIRGIYELLYDRLYEEHGWSMSWYEREKFEKNIKQKALIKTMKREICPLVEAFLPPPKGKITRLKELPGINLIHRGICSEKNIKLFNNLGIKHPEEVSIAKFLVEKFKSGEWETWNDEERKLVINFLFRWLKEMKWKVPLELEDDVKYIRLLTEKGEWMPANRCYIPCEELRKILPDRDYVDLSFFDTSGKKRGKKKKEEIVKFLKALGVLDHPRILDIVIRTPFIVELSGQGVLRWRDYYTKYIEPEREYSTQYEQAHIYILDGFDDHLQNRDERALEIYFSFILKNWGYYRRFINSPYEWFYYTDRRKRITSYFTFQIKENPWLPVADGLKRPTEVFAPYKEIRRVLGELVPYLKIDEKTARDAEEFLKLIGVHTTLDRDALVLALKNAKMFVVSKELRRRIQAIYSRLLEHIREGDCISESVHILSEDGEFHPSHTLYWNDCLKIGEVLKNEGHVNFAWIPPELSTRDLELLFSFLNVRRLSESISIKLLREQLSSQQLNIDYTSRLNERLDLIWSILRHYCESEEDARRKFGILRDLKIISVKMIPCLVKIDDHEIKISLEAYLDTERKELYATFNADWPDITWEMVRALHLPRECLSCIGFSLVSESRNMAEKWLTSQGIRLLELPEEKAMEEKEEIIIKRPIKPIPRESTEQLPVIEEDLSKERLIELTKPFIEPEKTNQIIKEIAETFRSSPIPPAGRGIKREGKYIIRKDPRLVASLNLIPKSINGKMILYIDSSISWEEVKPLIDEGRINELLELGVRIVKVMLKNELKDEDVRRRVRIMICEETTDALYEDNVLYLNAKLANRSSIFWTIVIARELAYIKRGARSISYAHVRYMCALLEEAFKHFREIDPEFFKRMNDA